MIECIHSTSISQHSKRVVALQHRPTRICGIAREIWSNLNDDGHGF